MERRRGNRRSGTGVVLIFPSGRTAPVAGELIDVSLTGFRAVHTCSRLQAGDTVRFRKGSKEGIARVIWNRIAAGQVESGFWIMDR